MLAFVDFNYKNDLCLNRRIIITASVQRLNMSECGGGGGVKYEAWHWFLRHG